MGLVCVDDRRFRPAIGNPEASRPRSLWWPSCASCSCWPTPCSARTGCGLRAPAPNRRWSRRGRGRERRRPVGHRPATTNPAAEAGTDSNSRLTIGQASNNLKEPLAQFQSTRKSTRLQHGEAHSADSIRTVSPPCTQHVPVSVKKPCPDVRTNTCVGLPLCPTVSSLDSRNTRKMNPRCLREMRPAFKRRLIGPIRDRWRMPREPSCSLAKTPLAKPQRHWWRRASEPSVNVWR